MKEETYPIKLTKNQMKKIRSLIEWTRKNMPFIPDELSSLDIELWNIIDHGCFKHKMILSRFDYRDPERGYNTTERICPKCDPKRYKELKSKYKECE